MGKLVLGVVTLALSAGTASAQGYGYDTPKIPSANRANTDARSDAKVLRAQGVWLNGADATSASTPNAMNASPLPAAVVRRGIRRLLCREGQRWLQ